MGWRWDGPLVAFFALGDEQTTVADPDVAEAQSEDFAATKR